MATISEILVGVIQEEEEHLYELKQSNGFESVKS